MKSKCIFDGKSFFICGMYVLGLMLSVAMVRPVEARPSLETEADVQCLVVGVRLASSTDPRQKLSGTMLAMYFLGRIDGRTPSADLQGLLGQRVNGMDAAKFKSVASRCETELSSRGAEMTKIGRKLDALVKRGGGG